MMMKIEFFKNESSIQMRNHTAFMTIEFLFFAKVFEMRLKVIVRLKWLATV